MNQQILQTIPEKIKQRRSQMLIHSSIYYEMNQNVVDDHTWQKWADELQVLQETYPEHMKIGFYDWEFQDWTGATGDHLPHKDPWVYSKALQLLKYHDSNERFIEINKIAIPVTTSNGTLSSPLSGSLDSFFS